MYKAQYKKKSFVTKENLRGTKEKEKKKIPRKTNERKRKRIFRSRSAKSRNLCVQYPGRGKEAGERERKKKEGQKESDRGWESTSGLPEKNILILSSFKSYCKRRGGRTGTDGVELFRGDGNDFGIKYDGDGRRVAGAPQGRSPVIAALVGYFNSGREGRASSFPVPARNESRGFPRGCLSKWKIKFPNI